MRSPLVTAGSVETQGEATKSIAQAVQHAAAGTAEVNSNIVAVTHVVVERRETEPAGCWKRRRR